MSKMLLKDKFWRQLSEAFRELSPEVVAQDADRPISLALVAEDSAHLRQMERIFVPEFLSPRKAEQVRERLCFFILPLGALELDGLRQLDLVICSRGAADAMRALLPRIYVFSRENPESVIKKILNERWDLALPLARNFLLFRRAVGRRSMRSVALENALFAVMSGLPDIVPGAFLLSRKRDRTASSTAFLTANQMRMAFLLAAANDSEVGFREQTVQMTAIAGAALGWRALARNLGNRIPSVPGLLIKALMAFGATYATGIALERLHRFGRSMTREEKTAAYQATFRIGHGVLDGILGFLASRSRSGSPRGASPLANRSPGI